MRGLRDPGPPRGLPDDLPRPVRAAAPRAGKRRHRGRRRRAARRVARHGIRRRRLQRDRARPPRRDRWPSGTSRYSTAGESKLANAQPFRIDCVHGPIAICHNGNLVNAARPARRAGPAGLDLPDEQRHRGRSCTSTRDRRPARSRRRSSSRSAQVRGAFSLALLTRDALIAVRDPHGFRPLALGRLGEAWVVSSETCALDLIGATFVRDVEPGEMCHRRPQGDAVAPARSPRRRPQQCIFEHVYFAGPTASSSARASTRSGRCWGASWRSEAPVEADVVVPVPDSGVCAAIGYAAESRDSHADGPHPQPLRRPHLHRAAGSRSATSA